MPLELTAEMVKTLLISGGGFIAIVIGAFTAFYKVQAKAAAEDRKQLHNLFEAIVTVPAADGNSGPNNGRTKLLVEQTHGMTDRLGEALGDIAKATAAQTNMIHEQGKDIKTMSNNYEERLLLAREWKASQDELINTLARVRICPRYEHVEESDKGHDI